MIGCVITFCNLVAMVGGVSKRACEVELESSERERREELRENFTVCMKLIERSQSDSIADPANSFTDQTGDER